MIRFFASALLAWMLPNAASAQHYSFAVPKMVMQVHVQPDASVRIVYDIEFHNYATAIDVVDVGLPHDDYSVGQMRASVGGEPVTRIAPSTYIDTGVEVQLGLNAIEQEGVFHFEAVVPDLVFDDTTDDALASLQITPTWFDASLLQGSTDLTVEVHLPSGTDPAQVLYQVAPFDEKVEVDGATVVRWNWPGAYVNGPNEVGVSFPKSVMARTVHITLFGLLVRWWEGDDSARIWTALILALLFGVAFFRFSAGTGCTVFGLLMILSGVLFYVSPRLQLYTLPVYIGLMALMEWMRHRKRTKYLPPIMSVEGGGIKRGLTPAEAAVILELPLKKVVTLAIFGLLKKGLLIQSGHDPLRVELAPDFNADSRKKRRKAAADKGVVVHEYEHAFLDALAAHPRTALEAVPLTGAVKKLIEKTAERVIGFDLEQTRKYYNYIVKRAWVDAESIGEVEARTEAVDRNLEWLLIDDGYADAFQSWTSTGYHYHPVWVRSSSGQGLGSLGEGLANAASGGGGSPGFGDVAASFAGWTENVSGQVASAIMPDSGKLGFGGDGGVVDFSGVDKVAGEVLEGFASSGGGSGGGGGCACAGCACACACAGGGR